MPPTLHMLRDVSACHVVMPAYPGAARRRAMRVLVAASGEIGDGLKTPGPAHPKTG